VNWSTPADAAYRPDIDGLRAFAVLAVVIFHAFPRTLPGGFAGVDVFFVISGYLISGIIAGAIKKGEFSLRVFYARRIRRIFPALSLVLLGTLLLGWFLLLPKEWKSLCRHTVAAVGFVSNFKLAGEAGYFDAAASTKPLLHLWSLAIEEQFYLFWPVTMLLLFRRWSRPLPGVVLLAGISFALNLITLRSDPTWAYYMPQTRVWELLAGAALACYALQHRNSATPIASASALREIAGITGAILLLVSVIVLNESRPYPGMAALLPVSGTCLLIESGPRAFINRTILANRAAVLIGLISYPLYLWHWPLLVYFNLVNTSDHVVSWLYRRAVISALVALAFVLSWATWRFWEKPMRSSQALSGPFRVRLLVGALATIALVAAGFQSRSLLMAQTEVALSQDDAQHLPINGPRSDRSSFTVYEIPSRSTNATLFVGDSHVEQLLPRIKLALTEHPAFNSTAFAVYDGCAPLPHLDRIDGYHCAQFYEYWTAQARQSRFSTIAITAYWEYYGELSGHPPNPEYPTIPIQVAGRPPTLADYDRVWSDFTSTLRALVEQGKRIVLYRSTPSYLGFDPESGLRRLRPGALLLKPASRKAFEDYLAPLNRKLDDVARQSGAEILNPLDTLCHGDICPAADSDGSPLYRDNNHLRASKAARLATFVDDALRP
jgi:peptidoglycan/LPS O-acetylase OafA/YrhL